MLGLPSLDVTIGLIFIYLVASLITSAVNELIENKLKNRSKDLERGIRELCSGDGTALLDQLYDHPLISALFKGKYSDAKKAGDLPSYIPSRNFALALMDIVGKASQSGVSGAANATAAFDPQGSITQLRAAAVAFGSTNAKVSQALVTLIDAAGNDAVRARENIEQWFDSSMDRVSGWYKRRSHQIVLTIGLLMAIIGNVDSINIVTALSKDPAKREALVAQAREYASKQKEPAAIVSSNDPTLKNIEKLGLPIGWSGTWANEFPYDPRSFPVDRIAWVVKVLGILLTAFAISLGAPFWFDTLNKFVVIRSTVKPTEKSPPEKPKE